LIFQKPTFNSARLQYTLPIRGIDSRVVSMKRDVFSIAAGAAFVLAGCTTTDDLGDLPLMWGSGHATLHVYSPEGEEIQPFQGQLIQFTGYSFSAEGVGILLGKKQVRYLCPSADDIVVHGDIPTIEFVFQAGKHYELRCVDGSPEIVERR